VNDRTEDKKDLEQLKTELKTAIDDVLFIGGTGIYDRGAVRDTRMSHEKTLTGVLSEKVPVSIGAYVEGIGYTKQSLGQPRKAMLRTSGNGILVENMQNAEDVDAVLMLSASLSITVMVMSFPLLDGIGLWSVNPSRCMMKAMKFWMSATSHPS
jgi:hypothetical protein